MIFAVIGGGLAVYGGVSLVRTRSFLDGAQRAEGAIVGWREERYSAGRTRNASLYPTLRFTVPDGRVVETEAEVSVSAPPADPESVTVLYDPADPRRARLSTAGGRGYTESLLFLVGGLLLAVVPYLLSLT